VFQNQIAQIGSASSRYTIFVSRGDEALAASRRVWGDKPRVGGIDPTATPFRQDLKKDNITAVDLTDVKSDDPLGHGTFAQSPEVVRAIAGVWQASDAVRQRRRGRRQARAGGYRRRFDRWIGCRRRGLGAFAVIDPRTRDNFGDNLEAVGTNLGATVGAGADAVEGR